MTSDQEDRGSPYLARPPRSLARACADIAGCGTGKQPCPDCPLGELCPARVTRQAAEAAAKRQRARTGEGPPPGLRRRA